MYFPGLPAGTYYIPVLASHPDYPTEYYAGDYTINVNGVTVEPDYCDASGGCDEYIENVTCAEINNTSGCEQYGDFTGMIANMQYSVGYPITITIGGAWSSDLGAVWIDWNQDLDFDDLDEAIPLDVSTGYGPYSGTITPPGHALAGNTRMRVRLSYSTMPGPCGVTSYGEVEDYTVNVGGEQSDFSMDPSEVNFGNVPLDATGSTTVDFIATGSAPINFDCVVSYLEKSSPVGGGDCDPGLKKSPFENSGHVAAHEKSDRQILWEGFEDGVIPPPGWSHVSNNAFTWEIDTYDPYEGSFNASCFYDETYSGVQDEWLVSSAMDFAGTGYTLDFWWLGSYYWSVDPYNNCNLEVWISVDGGTTWLLELWNEDGVGAFDDWTWYNAVIDLSAFKDESNVALGFRYSGYDGAQWSIDAIGVNPAPLSWLSVNPTAGTIPGDRGAVEVTLSYDADGLDEGTYNAEVVVTHTGAAKTVDALPVQMTVSATAPTDFEPDPIKALHAFMVEPIDGVAHVEDEDLPGGYTVADINPATVTVNGITPSSTDFPAESFFDVYVDLPTFVGGYGLLWDLGSVAYSVDGQFNDATPFSLAYSVNYIGHTSGDANLDGQANVGDAVFIINHVFKGGAAPLVIQTADANCDGNCNVGDAVRLVNYVFRSGETPCHE
jgi:hypothetical protein